ncbi:HEAT repeat domain-containing protein [Pseudobacteroides cellulosolvens]|uniref:HEAT repeat domain-containing protein n=1 Tax=Pseudobacteroides cellulosolvens ATCC 35603 = DSM 2933 TaxID=398512 RepID=A0A0L6JP11_9FIRM|nr:HEAT repeat domain-containing protein [Pseudobacteroides cellulosolvens]KNY27440.1 hypothetical protein Bccel_2711 [Pseudobacteroides cellulosolvens ATCC 35603 = DSM 2933]
MSIALLYDLQGEVRRLMIAGSELAIGDFRLKKLLPQFMKAGESAPVFARISGILEKLIEPQDGKASDKLLELAGLINAVLYTQGETGIKGELLEFEPECLGVTTDVSFRKIKPVADALLNKGQGRVEIIREAHKEGIFNDLRLLYPLINALNEQYYEVAELAFEILKGYGKDITKILKKRFSFEGGKGDARILELIWELSGKDEKELFHQANEKGSTAVRISAIKILKNFPEFEEMFIEFTKDKKKEIREAALEAAETLDTPKIANRLIEIFEGKDKVTALKTMKINPSRLIVNYLLNEAEVGLNNIFKRLRSGDSISPKDESAYKQEVEHFFNILSCMDGRKDEGIFLFLKKCMEHTKELSKIKLRDIAFGQYPTLAQMAAGLLLSMRTVNAYELLAEAGNEYNALYLNYSFEAAIYVNSPAQVFETYSGFFTIEKSSAKPKTIISVLRGLCYSRELKVIEVDSPAANAKPNSINKESVMMDTRWAPLLAKAGETDLAALLTSKGDEVTINHLLQCLQKDKGRDLYNAISKIKGLIQASHPKTAEVIIDLLEYNIKSKKYYLGYYIDQLAELVKLLPPENADVILEYARKCDYEGALKLIEAGEYLKKLRQ